MNGKEYFVTTPYERRNYAGAKQFCNRIGGKLFEPYTPQHNDDILIPARIKNVQRFWIGIHEKNKTGSFVYESNGQRVCRENWQKNEPNDYGSGEDCVEMRDQTTSILIPGKWNDYFCNDEKPFACERAST